MIFYLHLFIAFSCCSSNCPDESGGKRRVTQLNDQEKYVSTITKDVIEEDNSPSGDPGRQEVFECNICDADGFVRFVHLFDHSWFSSLSSQYY